MFSRKEQILQKSSRSNVGRFQFLSLLVQEFQKSNSSEAQGQVLANLSNFCYDPINYEFIRQLNVIDVFVGQLSKSNEESIHFSLSGLCNLSADPRNAHIIVMKNGIFLISQLLLHKNIEISLNAITTLILLINPETQASITTPEIINKALHYRSSANPRLRNLGEIFLNDHCNKGQIECAKKIVEFRHPRYSVAYLKMLAPKKLLRIGNKVFVNYFSQKSLKVGDSVTFTKMITKEDIRRFCEISGDTNPIHTGTDTHAAVVHGALLNSYVSSVIGTKLPGPGTLVVSQNLNFPKKCFEDESVTITVILKEIRKILRVEFVCEVSDKRKIVLYGDARLILK